MPKPMHPCGHPTCPQLVSTPYCPGHTVERWKDPEQARKYRTSRWRKLSEMVRKQEPFCRICRRARSAVTDHIDGDWRNDARENLRGLCRDCNATITAKQHRKKVGGGR